jgi:hypothetical protein
MRGLTARGLARSAAIGAVVGAVALASAPAAFAGPGDWTQLSTFSAATSLPQMTNTAELTLARFGDSTQVIWPGDTSTGSGYNTAILDGAGRVTTASTPVISNWSGVIKNPRLIALGGQRFLVFSGLDPAHTGAAYYATSADGVTWAVGPGSLSAANSVYAGYGNDAVDNAGTPVWAGQSSSSSGVNWHSGIAATAPAPAGTDGFFGLSGCCAYSTALARDEATGAVYTAFYSNANGTTEKGIQIGQILPTQGAFAQAPGSVTTNDYGTNSSSPDQRVAMTSRAGGGVYVAYGMGYPNLTGIRILEVGTGRTMDIAASGRVGRISLTSDPAGRLWLVYAKDNKVKAIHTNRAATAFGAQGSWGAPRGTDTLWHTAAVGTTGGLDVVISSNGTDGKINVWHTQALRTLSVTAAVSHPRRGTTVTFTVTDAGDPVAGATVKFRGGSYRTNAAGKASVRSSRGRFPVTAKKDGYNAGATSVRVR